MNKYILKRGIDNAKDQSYFLHRLTQEQLGKIMFPLGVYYKDEIKTMARKAGFGKYAEKPESHDFLEWTGLSPTNNTSLFQLTQRFVLQPFRRRAAYPPNPVTRHSPIRSSPRIGLARPVHCLLCW
jgi:hypothetical protein